LAWGARTLKREVGLTRRAGRTHRSSTTHFALFGRERVPVRGRRAFDAAANTSQGKGHSHCLVGLSFGSFSSTGPCPLAKPDHDRVRCAVRALRRYSNPLGPTRRALCHVRACALRGGVEWSTTNFSSGLAITKVARLPRHATRQVTGHIATHLVCCQPRPSAYIHGVVQVGRP